MQSSSFVIVSGEEPWLPNLLSTWLQENEDDMVGADADDNIQHNCRASLKTAVAELQNSSAASEATAPALPHLLAALHLNRFLTTTDED